MAKYQSKPYVVEAEKFKGADSLEKIQELCKKVPYARSYLVPGGGLVIETAQDFKYVYPGDYVVLDGEVLMTVFGERFERTHTLV